MPGGPILIPRRFHQDLDRIFQRVVGTEGYEEVGVSLSGRPNSKTTEILNIEGESGGTHAGWSRAGVIGHVYVLLPAVSASLITAHTTPSIELSGRSSPESSIQDRQTSSQSRSFLLPSFKEDGPWIVFGFLHGKLVLSSNLTSCQALLCCLLLSSPRN